jgi:hypothetical protein
MNTGPHAGSPPRSSSWCLTPRFCCPPQWPRWLELISQRDSPAEKLNGPADRLGLFSDYAKSRWTFKAVWRLGAWPPLSGNWHYNNNNISLLFIDYLCPVQMHAFKCKMSLISVSTTCRPDVFQWQPATSEKWGLLDIHGLRAEIAKVAMQKRGRPSYKY